VENGYTDLANLSDLVLVVVAGTIWMPAPGLAEADSIVASATGSEMPDTQNTIAN
jgi:hypothetical protein